VFLPKTRPVTWFLKKTHNYSSEVEVIRILEKMANDEKILKFSNNATKPSILGVFCCRWSLYTLLAVFKMTSLKYMLKGLNFWSTSILFNKSWSHCSNSFLFSNSMILARQCIINYQTVSRIFLVSSVLMESWLSRKLLCGINTLHSIKNNIYMARVKTFLATTLTSKLFVWNT